MTKTIMIMDLQMKNANLIERESVYLFSQNYSIISLNKVKPSFNYAYKIGGLDMNVENV